MKDIDFKELSRDNEKAIYSVYIQNKYIGEISITNDANSAIVKYNFDEKNFNYLIGSLLISEILHSALDTFKTVNESKIYFKDSCDVDHYLESLKIEKQIKDNKVCYLMKR